MTELLKKAFDAVAGLPEAQQDELAALLLEELASEQRWAQQFECSGEKLSELAAEALEEFESGRTSELDPEAL